MTSWDENAQKALNRLKRADDRGTGCHLTAEMVRALALTFLAEIWSEEAPPKPADTLTEEELDEWMERAGRCTYGNPDCEKCNPPKVKKNDLPEK